MKEGDVTSIEGEDFYDGEEDGIMPFSKISPKLRKEIELQRILREIKSGIRTPFPESPLKPVTNKK